MIRSFGALSSHMGVSLFHPSALVAVGTGHLRPRALIGVRWLGLRGGLVVNK